MSPHLSIEEKDGYLHATVTGSNTPENVLSYLAAVHSACAQRNCAAVLIEENLQGPGLGIASIYRVVAEASSNTRPAVRRIAYVDVNPEHAPERMKFAETFAYNRGVNVRVFASVGDARQWLLASPIR